MKTLARRLRRLEDTWDLWANGRRARGERASCWACLASGMRRYATSLGRDLTPEGQQRIAELERPRTMRVPLTIETVTEALHAGRQRAASGASE